MDTVAQLAPLEDACTIVLLRDGAAGLETLMLERPHNSRAFGGAWVFPGGKVDPEDRLNGTGRPLDDLAAAQVAGLRELAEETGQELGPAQLVWLAQWTPMHAIPRRFRTWFMLAPAASEKVVLNPEEHERYEWLAPAAALARHAEGKISLVPPTWVTLHNLAAMGSTAQALADARNHTPFAYNTHLLMPDAGSRPGATGTDSVGAASDAAWAGKNGTTGNTGPVLATAVPNMRGVRPAGVSWDGDEDYPGPAAHPGGRHRLTMTSLPWIFEHTGF